MDSQKDCVLLVSNEHAILFFDIDTKQLKVHVNYFGSALYNCVSDDDVGDYVVKLNWCWTLDVEHFM